MDQLLAISSEKQDVLHLSFAGLHLLLRIWIFWSKTGLREHPCLGMCYADRPHGLHEADRTPVSACCGCARCPGWRVGTDEQETCPLARPPLPLAGRRQCLRGGRLAHGSQAQSPQAPPASHCAGASPQQGTKLLSARGRLLWAGGLGTRPGPGPLTSSCCHCGWCAGSTCLTPR